MGRSASPITVCLDPSNSLTTSLLDFIISHSMVNFARELLGLILREDPVSTKTLDNIDFTHSMEMFITKSQA